MFALFWIHVPVPFAIELAGHATHAACPCALYVFAAHGVPTPAAHAIPAGHTAVDVSFPAPHMLLTYDPAAGRLQLEHTAFDDQLQAADIYVVPSTHTLHAVQITSLEDVHAVDM